MTTTSTQIRVTSHSEPCLDDRPADTVATIPAPRPRRLHRLVTSPVWLSCFAMVLGSLLLATGLLSGWAQLFPNAAPAGRSLVYYTVEPRDLAVSVTECGTLESQKNAQVDCEVDDVPNDGIYGTTILWIIENGTLVKKGDLVVELDATPHRERLEQEVLEVIYARSQFTARSLDYENRKTLNEMLEANTALAVESARLRLQQFEDEQGGTFQIALQNVELGIQQCEEQHHIQDRNRLGVQQLAELGYKSKGDLAQARLQALRAKTALDREMARKRELTDFSYVKSKLQLEGALQSAERNLLQVKRNNEAALAQNKVWMKMAELGKYWHELRKDRFAAQLNRCKIYAPQSGMVAYHVESNGWGSSTSIKEGVAVRYRQPILSIPDLNHMQVNTSVHETVVNRVHEGMRATVRIDAFPDRCYDAVVHSLDVLPDPGTWISSDTRTYKTVVTIPEQVQGIKPGMTAVVEIQLDHLTDVLCVPVQAIVQRGGKSWCYMNKNGQLRKTLVAIGQTNCQYAEIRDGLVAGDQIVLNTTTILDATDDPEIAADMRNPGLALE